MQHIDEERLETDIQYRFEYLSEFIGFGPNDIKAIQSSAPHLGPSIPQLVDQTYQKLLTYDATARHFLPRQHGFDGPTPEDLESLTAEHPQVQFRRDHLNRYFIALIGRSYDAKMIQYLDMVGRIHTPGAGNKQIQIPLVQMNALMGVISGVLLSSISEWPIAAEDKARTIDAFNKLLWIQNDFITRHYAMARSQAT